MKEMADKLYFRANFYLNNILKYEFMQLGAVLHTLPFNKIDPAIQFWVYAPVTTYSFFSKLREKYGIISN